MFALECFSTVLLLPRTGAAVSVDDVPGISDDESVSRHIIDCSSRWVKNVRRLRKQASNFRGFGCCFRALASVATPL